MAKQVQPSDVKKLTNAINEGPWTSEQKEILHNTISKPKKAKKDPIAKILSTNKRVMNFKQVQNQKLLKILERVDLDQPILMQDKLKVLWDGSREQFKMSRELDALKT